LGMKEELHGRATLPARRSRLPRDRASSIRSKRRRSYTTGHGDVDFRGVDGGGAGGVDGGGGVGEVRTATAKMEARTLLELFPRDDASYPDSGCELRRPSRGRARRPHPPPCSPAASSSMPASLLRPRQPPPPPCSPAASSTPGSDAVLGPVGGGSPRHCPLGGIQGVAGGNDRSLMRKGNRLLLERPPL
jgi:hypothetical protein